MLRISFKTKFYILPWTYIASLSCVTVLWMKGNAIAADILHTRFWHREWSAMHVVHKPVEDLHIYGLIT